MRLLNINTLRLEEFHEHERPPYAITSHRWGRQEVTFDEISEDLSPQRKEIVHGKAGYQKIERFAAAVTRLFGDENIEWIWFDTCCIDKRNSSELAEALNSMFRWYRQARVCLAYLHDFEIVPTRPAIYVESFSKAEWFLRGWTLQELLSPRIVVLLDMKWNPIGYKAGHSPGVIVNEALIGGRMNEAVAAVTGIPTSVIEDVVNADDFPLSEKRRWMGKRMTTRIEDMAYCQLGIFGIFMPPIYGEGENAFVRLEEEIEKSILRRAPRTGTQAPPDRAPQTAPPWPSLTAIAKYTFEAQEAADLGFVAGEIISVSNRTSSTYDWWTGRIGNREGIFPGNYVEIVPQPGQAVALYSFEPSQCQSGDLSFNKGDVIIIVKRYDSTDSNKWWIGRIGDKQGTFPSNYVKVV